jgi:hypothetical protein
MRLTENFVAATPIGFSIPGDYFYLDSAPAGLVTVRFFRDGKTLAEDLTDVIAGWHAKPRGGFDRAEITSSVTQAMGFYISRGEVGNILVARPVWHDRNPLTKGLIYSANLVAPHADTVRWTYTVPAGKKALIEQAQVAVLRSGAATAVAVVRAYVQATTLDVGTSILAYAAHHNIAANVQDGQVAGGTIMLAANQVLEGKTDDPSTGGTNTFMVSAKLTEFDA